MELLHPDLLKSIDEGFTVLAPNRRTAHALRQAYAGQALAAGRTAWQTPDILTMSAWAERTWLVCRSTEHGQRLLSAQQAGVLWERIVGASGIAASLLNPLSAARAAARSWELAQAYGIPLSAIQAEPSEEALAFATWAARFDKLCAEQRWVPPAHIIPALLECDTLLPARLQLALAEGPTPMAARLFKRIIELGGEVRAEPPVEARGTTHVLATTEADQELRLAAQWARQWLDAGCASIGVVVPDLAQRRHDVLRVFEDTFVPAARRTGESPSGVPFTLEVSSPLAEFAMVRAALDLLVLVQGGASSAVAGRVLRSAFFAGCTAEASARALADAGLRSAATEQSDILSLERLAGASECPMLATQLATMRPLLPRRDELCAASEWAERFLKLLAAAGWPGDRALSSAELQTLAKFHDALGGFGGLEDLLGRVSFGAALTQLQQWLAAVAFEPQSLPTPISIVDPDSVAGMRFTALWIMGCDAARMPPAPDPDPFIPLRLQQLADIPGATAADCHDRAARELAQLRGSAAFIVCSWSRLKQDAEQTSSPLLREFEPFTEPLAPAPSLAEWLQQQRPALEVLRDDQAPAVRPGRVGGGARVIELQSWCPFRAQAELRLGARPLERVSPGVDARERGMLLHKALEALWSDWRTHERLMAIPPDELRQRILAELDRCSVPLLKGASPHRARLLRIEVDLAASKIADLLALERERQPFAVLERPEYAATYAAGGLEIDLKIDRIDVLQATDGAAGEVVIDYKTGNSSQPRKWWGARPEQPQLPLYAVARRERLAAVAFAILKPLDSQFRGIAQAGGVLPGIREFASDPAAWPALLDDWQRTVDDLIAGYARGDAHVDPLPQACARCHVTGFCRVHESQQPVDEPESPL